MELIKRREHLSFGLCDFNFFRRGDGGTAIPFVGRSRLLILLVAIPYVLGSELVFFRARKYFLKLKQQVVGILVIREKPESLYVDSLAIGPQYRRHRFATYILDRCARIAIKLEKKWLELTVLKANLPARQLYRAAGFVAAEEKRMSIVLRKSVSRRSHSIHRSDFVHKS